MDGANDSDDDPHDRRRASEAALRKHVGGLFRQPFAVLPGGDLTAAAAAGFGGYIAESPVLLVCGALLVLIGLVRFAAQRRFRSASYLPRDIGAIRAWYFRYTLLSWLAAAAIGAIGWLGAVSGIPAIQLLAAAVVFASTATMVRTGSHPSYVLVQIALAFLPMIAGWATVRDPVFVLLTTLSFVYLGLHARIAFGLHRLTFGALTSAERNLALAERLEQKNEQLEQQEAQLRAQALRFDAALENMAQGLALFDGEHRMVVCNHRYLENYRFDPNIVKPGATLRDVVDHYVGQYPEAAIDAELYYERQLRLLTRDEPIVFARTLGDGRQLQVNYSPMPGGGYVVTTEDVTEQRSARERMAHLASHDPLTNLVNRYELPHRLRQALTALDRRRTKVAVFALGLDRFKQVNDSLGHPIGDAILQAAAERLKAFAGAENIVARLGGDEFVCVITDLESREGLTLLAERMSAALARPYEIEGRTIEISASMGISVAPGDGDEAEVLMRSADVALHRAKAEGRGGFVFFGPDMERVLRERHDLENDLRSGLQHGEFELHYQPLVDASTRRLAGCEALLRWNHPRRGLLMPDQFIGIAEDSGLIVQIGDWVLRTACAEAAAWPRELKIAVNVSPVQLGGATLLNSVVSTLAQSRLDPQRLELEITEAVLLRDTEETLATLGKLRELGVRIVMDDFGTGYSSLNYLRIFPFDKIKIDRSFVAGCKSRTESHAIIQAVADLAHGLGMTTTAEGIETEEQLSAVRDRGCTEAQGFLFARPMPAAALRDFMSGYTARRAAA